MESSNLSLSIIDKALVDFFQRQQMTTTQTVFIALSGGLDSSVLLHALAQVVPCQQITAIHINHCLQPNAEHVSEHCKQLCDGLHIKLITKEVKVEQGASLELQARKARFDAFTALMPERGWLFLAHHLDDQVETFFLRLLRGAALKGLRGIQEVQSYSGFILARPFLSLYKHQLQDYANTHEIIWQEDKSNQDTKFKRNALRADILPNMWAHFGQRQAQIYRSMQQLNEDYQSLTDLLEPYYQVCHQTSIYPYTGACSLQLDKLQQQPVKRQNLIIRHWFSRLGLYAPNAKQLAEIQHSVIAAKFSATPEYRYQNGFLTRYQGVLYWILPEEPALGLQTICLNTNNAAQIPNWGAYCLRFKNSGHLQAGSYQLQAASQVAVRQLDLPKRGHKTFKQLFQEGNIPPWLRSSYPVLLRANKPVALLNLGIDSTVYCSKEEGVTLSIDFRPAHLDGF